MDEAIYKNTILPLKGNKHHATVAITTPGNNLNWFSYLQDLRDDSGELVFKTIFSGTACAACRREKKAADCTHIRLPKWKNAREMNKVRAILGQDDQAIFEREMKGTVTVDQVQIYAQYVPRLKKQPLHEFKYPVDSLETFIDSAGGAASSDFVIQTQCSDDGRDVVNQLNA